MQLSQNRKIFQQQQMKPIQEEAVRLLYAQHYKYLSQLNHRNVEQKNQIRQKNLQKLLHMAKLVAQLLRSDRQRRLMQQGRQMQQLRAEIETLYQQFDQQQVSLIELQKTQTQSQHDLDVLKASLHETQSDNSQLEITKSRLLRDMESEQQAQLRLAALKRDRQIASQQLDNLSQQELLLTACATEESKKFNKLQAEMLQIQDLLQKHIKNYNQYQLSTEQEVAQLALQRKLLDRRWQSFKQAQMFIEDLEKERLRLLDIYREQQMKKSQNLASKQSDESQIQNIDSGRDMNSEKLSQPDVSVFAPPTPNECSVTLKYEFNQEEIKQSSFLSQNQQYDDKQQDHSTHKFYQNHGEVDDDFNQDSNQIFCDDENCYKKEQNLQQKQNNAQNKQSDDQYQINMKVLILVIIITICTMRYLRW